VASGNNPTGVQGETWPNGPPSTYVKTQFPPEPGAQADRQLMVDTVVGAAPAEQRESLKKLLETASEASVKQAFEEVLEARKTPGKRALELTLVPTKDETTTTSDDGGTYTHVTKVELPPVKVTLGLEVDARGRVNGAPLVADELTKLSTELKRVPVEEKLASLREAGVSEEWIGNTTEAQKDAALAKLRAAAATPGEKTVDLSFEVQETISGGDGDSRTETRRIDGKVKLSVDEQGKVGGKQPRIEVALATTNQFDQLSTADKVSMLERVGFPKEDIKGIAPERMTTILTRVAMAMREPGERSIEVDTGPDKFAVGLKVGKDGELEGIGVQKLPPPPKKKGWMKVLGPVLTVASFVFPAAAPFIRLAQAGLAVASGARGLGLAGALLGAASGLAGAGFITGSAATFINTANQVVSTARSVQGAIQGFRSGDILGGLSNAIAAGQGAAGLAGRAGLDVSQARDFLNRAGDVVGTANRVVGTVRAFRSGDLLGGLGGALDLADSRGLLEGVRNAAGQVVRDGVAALTGPDDDERPPAPVEPDGQPLPGTDGTIPDADLAPLPPLEPTTVPSLSFPTTVTVRPGDNLTRIATANDDPSRVPELYAWNAHRIGDNPNLIQPSMELEVPPPDFQLSPEARAQFYARTHLPPMEPRPPPAPPADEPELLTPNVGSPGPRPTTTAPRSLPELQTSVEGISSQAEATAALRALSRQGGPVTLDDHLRMVRSLEVLNPNLTARDIAEHVRQRYYPDHPVFMNVGATVNPVQPLSEASANLFMGIPRGHQDVRGPDGQLLDIAHTYVGANANLNGRPLAGAVFTHVGDGIQGALAAVGIGAGGNANDSDLRGNALGSRIGLSASDLATPSLNLQLQRQNARGGEPLSQQLLRGLAGLGR
jgi:hypothetical protein